MRQLIPDVYLIEDLRGDSGNVYVLVSGDGLTLVDSGLVGAADQITAQLQEAGYVLSDVQTIVLTHFHGDHSGSVAELARRCGARVLAHRYDVPYIERTGPLPFDSLLQRLLNWLGFKLLKPNPCQVNQVLQDEDVIEALDGLQVIHTPGHTRGSIALYQPERQILFCGDTFFNKNPLTGRKGLRLSIPLFTMDRPQMRASARKLAELPVEVLCFGHGEPMLKGAGARIQAMLSYESG